MQKLLNTKQVRAIIRANGGTPLYTNKTKGHTGNIRRVKCYFDGNADLLAALDKASGIRNVNWIMNNRYAHHTAITIKCVLE